MKSVLSSGRSVLVLALAVAACAVEPVQEFHSADALDNNPSTWGKPLRIVAPDYPPALLASGHTGYVDLGLRIGGLGEALDVTYTPDAPASEPFVQALKPVLPYWAFHVPTDDDCLPSNQRVTTRVWFELEGGKPHVSLEVLTKFPAPTAPAIDFLKATHRVEPRYPKAMISGNYQSNVFARIEIDPHGDVLKVTAKGFPAANHPEVFEKETVDRIKLWKYNALPAGHDEVRDGCYTVLFRLH